MRCSKCGCLLDEDNYCSDCMEFIEDDELNLCPKCGSELDEDNYCRECFEFFSDDTSSDIYDEPDYNSMVNKGDEICLNCTYWSVSPYGASHGMYCRRGNGQTEPNDSCYDFVQSHHYANYGDSGQYQFNETSREISNKLYHWKNNR